MLYHIHHIYKVYHKYAFSRVSVRSDSYWTIYTFITLISFITSLYSHVSLYDILWLNPFPCTFIHIYKVYHHQYVFSCLQVVTEKKNIITWYTIEAKGSVPASLTWHLDDKKQTLYDQKYQWLLFHYRKILHRCFLSNIVQFSQEVSVEEFFCVLAN